MFEYIMFTYGNQIVGMIIVAIFGVMGLYAKKFLNDKTKLLIAKSVVLFVEQVYKNLHGEEKLQKALERASKLLAEKGIKFSANEMETLIEAAVAEFNKAFEKKAITE